MGFPEKEEHIRQFNELGEWKRNYILRYIWSLAHHHPPKRDLELWIGDLNDPYDGMRLKIWFSNVSEKGYDTVSLSFVLLEVELNEHGQYVFSDLADDKILLFECDDFEFRLEQVPYDEV